jgi:hypothetical protein
MNASFVRVAAGLAVLTLAGVWIWQVQRESPAAPQAETPPAAPPAPEPPPRAPAAASTPSPEQLPAQAPVQIAVQTAAEAGIPEADCIAYPDGTKLPPLNGVTKAPAVTFHRLVPFAKVVRKERDPRTGLEWYIHENGVRSTTRLQWRNGVQEAVSEVDMPRTPAPVVPEK